MAYTTIPPGVGSSGGAAAVGARGKYTTRAATYSGLDPTLETTGDFWEDFVNATTAGSEVGGYAWTTAVTSGNYSNLLALAAGGIVRLNTTAGANRIVDVYQVNNIVERLDTKRWYHAWRGRLTTAGDATTMLGCGLRNNGGTRTIMAGFFGALNAGNFGVQYDGLLNTSFLSLGVALDTAFHIFETYCTGDGTIRARIDGGSEVSAAMASAPTDAASLLCTIRNGATGAAQTGDLDWILTMFARL